VALDVDLSWSGGDPDIGDIVTYDVFFGTVNPPPQVAFNQSDDSYNLPMLAYNTQYYWKVVSWDNHGASNASPLWNFTTRANKPPYEPQTPFPSNGAIGVALDVDLSWSGGDPDIGDIVTYDVFFGTVNPPPQVAFNQSDTSYNLPMLAYNTQYYWKVVSWDDHGASTSGPLWNFTTRANKPPYEPRTPFPANGAIGIDLDADLSWAGGDPDPGDTVTYDVYFGTASTPPQVAFNQSDTSYDLGILSYNTTYYWRVVSWDNHGLFTPGPLWNFTTASGEELTFVWVDDDYNETKPGWDYIYFARIQDGVNAVAENGTVFVYNGTYYENILINKTIDLLGENTNTTIIDANESGDVIYVSVDHVNISGFTIRTSTMKNVPPVDWNDAALDIRSNDTTISGNTIIYNNYGIYLQDAFFNTIDGNTITDNNDGIHLFGASNNTITGNTITDNENGVYLQASSDDNMITRNTITSNYYNGIYLVDSSHNNIFSGNTIAENLEGIRGESSSDNTITENTITNNTYNGISLRSSSDNNDISRNTIEQNNRGVDLRGSSHNTISENDITNNERGVQLGGSGQTNISANNFTSNDYGMYIWSSSNNNLIYHNNFVDNTYQAHDECTNTWDNGYPSGGNYWNDFDEPSEGAYDDYRGPQQNQVNYDGIVDKGSMAGGGINPYIHIGHGNQDQYPLIFPWGANPPVASFTFSVDDVTATFDASSSYDRDGTIVLYHWDFGDGTQENGVFVDHTYSIYEIYTVTLTVTDNDGKTGILSQSVTLEDHIPPEIQDYTGTIGYTGDPFTFNATITDHGGVSTAWVEYWYDSGSHTNVSMTHVAGSSWGTTISIANTLDLLHYVIATNDTSNNWNVTGVKQITIYDNDNPDITGIQAIPPVQMAGRYVNLSAVVTDNIETNAVYLHLVHPDMTIEYFPITHNRTGDRYYCNRVYTLVGKYIFYFWANDTSGNYISSATYNFTMVLCGDCNNDGTLDVIDVVYLINYLFINGPDPIPDGCVGDCNGDGTVDVSDVVYLINYLFIHGPAPSGCCG
jgi:parallel beta-helix repeat protein